MCQRRRAREPYEKRGGTYINALAGEILVHEDEVRLARGDNVLVRANVLQALDEIRAWKQTGSFSLKSTTKTLRARTIL